SLRRETTPSQRTTGGRRGRTETDSETGDRRQATANDGDRGGDGDGDGLGNQVASLDVMRRLASEALGTFILVFGGCGTAVLAAKFPAVGVGLLGVSIAFGLTVLAGVY